MSSQWYLKLIEGFPVGFVKQSLKTIDTFFFNLLTGCAFKMDGVFCDTLSCTSDKEDG